MSLSQRILGWIVLLAIMAVVLAVGWLIAAATHHMVLFWIAVIVEVAFMAYTGWSNWKRNAKGS
jgi:cobalamin biosynthesis protein CobD/CbiB